ncbi:phosphoribosylformylglycinamidine cyclo-ligase [Lentibacillus cibarius]|uniref:Phosphoribosylformylglycinamidine cyclo-ligase n=1 Tax=Lentibacillus cibarius TaxID=2583219 RepID=A0A5S3QM86_9BACI|nr:phosphoribosylformylglycinamidine cyclo-ligase [Lentibacillus cibarius]TMN22778.1 phosphoribosylformylglycinamidine cyclo-ligase [Lentibacillus cibarius]
MENTYKAAGVDVEQGYEAVRRMKRHVAKTARPEMLDEIGAFAGLFDLSSFNYQEPVLVSGTDGVGTKLKLAAEMQKHDTVGIDLVAMCVNDIVAQGAQPLFFLDYIACGKTDPALIEQVVAGISQGCIDAGAGLIGGETAEMPGMYQDDEYDLAGFTVGIAEKSQLVTGASIATGDTIIGLTSSGIHSNGYSLVRKLVEGLDFDKMYTGLTAPLGNTLLTPTKIYAKSVAAVMKEINVKGIAHITGGGFHENLPRMMPEGLGAEIDVSSWQKPDVFSFLQRVGDISDEEMYRVFNMGIGMAIVVAPEEADTVLRILETHGETATVIGKTVPEEGVHLLP